MDPYSLSSVIPRSPEILNWYEKMLFRPFFNQNVYWSLKAIARNLSDVGESAWPCSKGVQNNTFSYQFGNLWALIDLD